MLKDHRQRRVEKIERCYDQAQDRLSGNEARSRQHSGILHPSFLGSVEAALVAHFVGEPANDAADENGKRSLQRQVHADGEEHDALYFQQDHGESHQNSRPYQRPGHVAAHNALRQRSHEAGLRR